MNITKFTNDLKFGKEGEMKIVHHLVKKGLKFKGTSDDVEKDNKDEFKYYDLLFINSQGRYVKIEVKTDNWVTSQKDSGNLVIEKSCNGKPSGISTSKSDYWVYYFANLDQDNLWMIRKADLKTLVELNSFHLASGGDNNRTFNWLIPRYEFKHYFRVETITE